MSRCYAKACPATVRPGILMCRSHWGLVSKPTQGLVYGEWRRVQRTGGITKEYLAAIDKARQEVEQYTPVVHRTRDLLTSSEKWEES